MTAKLVIVENTGLEVVTGAPSRNFQSVTGKLQIDVDKLINQLSFTHIIEL